MLKEIYELKAKLKSQGRKGLALDIDDTLSVSRLMFFRAQSERLGLPAGETIESLMQKYEWSYKVPQWQTAEGDLVRAELLHSSELHGGAELIKGAVEGVTNLDRSIPIVAYITARPVTLQAVTQDWLDQKGFPKADLILKPMYANDNNGWKAEVLDYLYPEVLGIVDDNPGLVDKLPDDYKGRVYLYENTNVNDRGLDVVHCPDWESVVSHVKTAKWSE